MTDIDLVINLKLREDVLVEKCLGRRICSQCGGNFNLASIDVKGENGQPGINMAPLLPPAHCMSKLITRADDTEEVVKERLRIYDEKVLYPFLAGHFFTLYFLRRSQVYAYCCWSFCKIIVSTKLFEEVLTAFALTFS